MVRFVERPSVDFCHFFYFRRETLCQFIFCDTANRGVFWKKTDICQIIQYREERNLRKLCDACDKDKLLVVGSCFQYGKHILINSGAFCVSSAFLGMLKWCIVFVDENDYTMMGLLVSCLDDLTESNGETFSSQKSDIVLFLVFSENVVKV